MLLINVSVAFVDSAPPLNTIVAVPPDTVASITHDHSWLLYHCSLYPT